MFVIVYLRIYAKALVDALAGIGRNAWTLVLPMGLVLAWLTLGQLVAPLGFAGGFLLALARSAAFSIYTYFVAQVVAKQRVGLSDFKTSIGAYFWTWINLFFVLWIIDLLLGPMRATPDGQRLRQVISMMELVVLNAAPEVIYLKRTSGGLDTIQRSFVFLQECWIEWFIPNGIILGLLWLAINGTIPVLALPAPAITVPVLAGALLHVVMVFRGQLFQMLDGSTHRQRMFKYRNSL
jgi:hypothetical protein